MNFHITQKNHLLFLVIGGVFPHKSPVREPIRELAHRPIMNSTTNRKNVPGLIEYKNEKNEIYISK